MKLHLPIALALTLLAAQYGNAGETVYRPAHIETVETNITATTENGLLDNLTAARYASDMEGVDSTGLKTYTKDGQGTLTVEGDVTTHNTVHVREGGMTFNNSTVTVDTADGYSFLVVAGNNATLTLNNSNYSQYRTPVSGVGSSTSISIGTYDGAGSVILNNSTLHTDHCIFAGRTYSSWNGANSHTLPSYAGKTGETAYSNGTAGQSYIKVVDSTLSSGTTMYLENVKMDISGSKSCVTDYTRTELPRGEEDENGYYSYSWVGTDANAKTEINVTDGASLEFSRGLGVAYGSNSDVDITVSDKGSSFSVVDEVWVGYAASGSSTSISIVNGADATFGDNVYLGSTDEVTFTIGEASTVQSAEDTWLYIYSNADVSNAGELAMQTYLTGGDLTAKDGSTMASVYAGTGTLTVDGAVTIEGLTVLEGASLVFDGTDSAIDLAGKTLTLADNASIIVNLAEGQSAEDLTLFTNAAAGTVSTVAVTFVAADNTTTTGTVAVGIAPEPTTATLSLLALAALAARRRRH